MTSIFDQYEQASQKTTIPSQSDKPEPVPINGFVNMKLEDEAPMFTKQKVNFAPTNQITHLVVGGNTIVLAMANNVLLRINLSAPDVLEEVKLQSKLLNLFMDPTGTHTIAALEGSDVVYLQPSGAIKTKPLPKLKGNFITSMIWTPLSAMLFGTVKGDIMETELEKDSIIYVKQLFNINKRIFDIHMLDSFDECTIHVCTVDRIYIFKGYPSRDSTRPVFSAMFQLYLSRPESCIEEKNFLKYSKLQILSVKDSSRASMFGWYIDRGLLLHDIGSLASPHLVEVPPGVISFILTEYHALLLYPDHVTGVSLLSRQIVFEDFYNETHGRLVDIVKDSLKGRIWVIAEQAVFRYKVIREDRHVWQLYVEQGDWDRAKVACADNPANLDIVTQKQAEFHFKAGEYEFSALLWARTQASLEAITLQFLHVWQVDPLRTYLKKKLDILRSEDKAQITMIVMWVMELYLYELGELRNSGREFSEEYRMLQVNLDIFLSLPQVTEFVSNHRTTVYDLIASHGDKQNLIKLTIATKDYERNIRHLIQEENYKQALNVLCSQNNPQLWYTFVPTLLQVAPKLCTDTLISYKIQLDADQWLSSLMSSTDENVQMKFLEYSIHSCNCQSQSVHNFLLLLYARHNPATLNEYLAMQGTDPHLVNFDVHYGLRVVQQYSRWEACVTIYCVLGLWEQAVDMALERLGVEVAKQTALMPSVHDARELKRKLWLKIAAHVVSEQNDIETALEFLKERRDLISIEDILPFFSDLTCMDKFKSVICDSLEQYNQHIVDLKEEMADATSSAEEIRTQIQACGNRYYIVQSTDTCALCNVQLVNNAFYIFPCSHKFHSRCIIEDLEPDQKAYLEQLTRSSDDTDSSSSGGVEGNFGASEGLYGSRRKNKVMDAYLSRECPFCGSRIIDLIDKPFINPEDIERIAKEWE